LSNRYIAPFLANAETVVLGGTLGPGDWDTTPREADRQRMQELNISLDQCWDLLRQRRALRDAGRDPDDATIRGADVVEHYEQ